MNIALYTTKSAKNKLNKTLADKLVLTGTLRDEGNVKSPSILIHVDDLDGAITKYNYAYIPKFKKYYYITSKDVVRSHIWRINLYRDVLYTYKDQIKNCEAIVVKQENDANNENMTNKMLVDGTYQTAADIVSDVVEFDNEVKRQQMYILTVL